VYLQWIAKLKQLIGMIGEDYYNYITKIRLYSAERAGGWGQRLFGTPIFLKGITACARDHLWMTELSDDIQRKPASSL
jgi:hypothetical protein